MSVSIFLGSAGSSFLGDSGRRRPTGLSCISLMGDVRPDPEDSPNGLPLPRSTLLRCCFMRLISAIHAGWAGGACFGFGLGDSGLLRALSNQLDFVGLHRFEGLGGDVSSCGASFSLKVDATDLALLWRGKAGLTNSSLSGLSFSVPVMVALLWLDMGRDGSIELSLVKTGRSTFESEP